MFYLFLLFIAAQHVCANMLFVVVLFYYTGALLLLVALYGFCSILTISTCCSQCCLDVLCCLCPVIFLLSSKHLAKGLQLKISQLANTGTFTEKLNNVRCPYE